MAKHGRDECSSGKVSKSRDKKGASIDRISSLPDELLVLILSSLPFKEAVASSILSCRWRYLWTFINKLDFDGTSSMLKLVGERLLLLDYKGRRSYEARVNFEVTFGKRRLDYIEWVNHVIASNKSPDIEEFRVFFDLTKYNKNSIDEWLRFALTRKVQRLELNLTSEASNKGCLSDCYTFDPYNLLKGSFSHLIDHFKYLKKLFLNHVNVNDEALEFLLFNSRMLEHLSLSTSISFRTLRIIGPFTSFKRLEIDSCYNLESVEIRDVNLVYVKYRGSRIDFVVENVPLLVEMYIEGWIKHIQENLLQFSNYLPQLEILTISCISIKQMTEDMCSALKMRNLKQLIVKARIHDDDHSLIPLTNLVNASPCLQRFVLEATHVIHMPLFIESNARKIVRSYPQLKQIEFVGYRGVMSEQELLTHLLDNAVALEKIVIDTRSSNRWWNYLEKLYFDTREKRFTVVESVRAMKLLQGKVPPTINLKILI